MKKYVMIIAALAAAMTISSSCAKEQAENEKIVDENGMVRMTFAATAEDADTKAVLNADGKTVEWEGTESIAIFADDASDPLKFNAESAGVKTSFSGSVPAGSSKFNALYPYNASATWDGTYYHTEVPVVQTAVLGSFDPNAAICIAENNDLSGKLSFKNCFALLKVNVDVDNVIAVIVENTSKAMAGKVKVSTGGGTSDGEDGLSKEVVLKKEDNSVLSTGTYYIVVRSLGSAVYSNFKMTYVTSAKQSASRTTTNDITGTILGRKAVLNVGSLSSLSGLTTSYFDWYRAYQDIRICDVVINRSKNGDAIKIVATGEKTPSIKDNMATGGVIFVSTPAGTSLNNSGAANINTADCYLISDTDDNAVVVSSAQINLMSKSFYAKNITFDATGTTKNVFSNSGSSANTPHFMLDACMWTGGDKALYQQNSTAVGYGVNDIVIRNCRFAMQGAYNIIAVQKDATSLAMWKTIDFSNNYVYSTTGANLSTLVFSYDTSKGSATDGHEKIVFNNNLFYHTASTGTIKTYTVADLTAKNNIITIVDDTVLGSSASNAKVFALKAKPTTGTSSDNYAYGTVGGGKGWAIADSGMRTSEMKNITVAPSDPIASANTATGTFTMASGYESYGPQAL